MNIGKWSEELFLTVAVVAAPEGGGKRKGKIAVARVDDGDYNERRRCACAVERDERKKVWRGRTEPNRKIS
jgi:hypothetical protein